MQKKVILAYSGGLDTTTIIPWLKENYDYEVICVCIDVGQGQEIEGLEERALASGASKLYIEDLKDEFVEDFVWPTLKAQAIYENKYLLGTSIARPLISKRLVEIAKKEQAEAICHGATGKGNDQVRFELTIKALAPELKIIAPWRIWDIKSREDAIEYCRDHGIDLPFSVETSYSRDRNLWHLSHEGLELEDIGIEPDYDKLLQLSVSPEKAPDTPEYIELEFDKGIPVALNGEKLAGVAMIEKLNALGGKHGIGTIDLLENRVVGMKSRGIYETPGGTILYAAHSKMEELCLDKQTIAYKSTIAIKYAELIYSGEWYTPLREALEAFVNETQKTVTGKVKLKLYKGNIIPAGASSDYSLYSESLASFATGDLYNHHDAEGFINLFGLPLKVRAMLLNDKNDQ
ncbi:argininosuccinate synthase [Natranaerovirga hydrolytica]|uniref:Argininosuccinate synthase n=1 Tax=Natranaerovirga hydrolytica TaxID=680378 RepID=A0A4R1N326_9FIRM|nr:argininosuccinate synthase [Natranaerovirga hydrolytica]TCK98424.1 argininosuccinate synthase [Natranaerovirga hydrolytica]